jgi:hypothetical protein
MSKLNLKDRNVKGFAYIITKFELDVQNMLYKQLDFVTQLHITRIM